MRRLFLSISLFVLVYTGNSQHFKFIYTETGLGSNLGRESDPEVFADSTLTYVITEYFTKVDPIRKDTVWDERRKAFNVPFRATSKDSILVLLKGNEGKYIYNSNPHILSGAIFD